MIRPQEPLRAAADMPHQRRAGSAQTNPPVFHGYYGFDPYFYYAWMWAGFFLAKAAATVWIVVLILAMLVAHVIEVWIFGLTYWVLDLWPALGTVEGTFDEGVMDYVYFSVVNFTTLGFGDVLAPDEWRILGSLIGANGMLAFGLATAALVAFVQAIRDDLTGESSDDFS